MPTEERTPSMFSIRRKLAAVVVGAAGALALFAPAANAGPIIDNADCTARPPLSQIFLPWLDVMDYVTSPGGGFETGAAGWVLQGGAAVVNGNGSHYVGDPSDSKSLSLPPGSSANSAPTCVGLEYPTIRFFSRSSGTGLLSLLRVSVLYESAATGAILSAPIGVVTPSSSWRPSLPMVIAVNTLGALQKDGMVPVAFKFAAIGPGSWQIDDLYIDPRRGP